MPRLRGGCDVYHQEKRPTLPEPGVREGAGIGPGDISFTPGDRSALLTVVDGEEDRCPAASVTESHRTATLAVMTEPGHFHVVTVARHHRWTGSVYFTAIRPFHHLVVLGMARAAIRGPRR
ncbi:hypothetical protein FHS43_003922 [Streptosporangium becharense]|uniref:DUF2867 domain-containing protein n=1 Tax=Streptosporangium becharense TaxID=1816182 RepID=A0A7W9IGU8_9ACTN|nr:DUF2867 domain-containing protein [Streptosporangium becharense]MBB2912639.1 hypothetical protein [Streptosporangium becharense]MBB5820532.1 hypothetical protein [Streptosporangium becharense]